MHLCGVFGGSLLTFACAQQACAAPFWLLPCCLLSPSPSPGAPSLLLYHRFTGSNAAYLNCSCCDGSCLCAISASASYRCCHCRSAWLSPQPCAHLPRQSFFNIVQEFSGLWHITTSFLFTNLHAVCKNDHKMTKIHILILWTLGWKCTRNAIPLHLVHILFLPLFGNELCLSGLFIVFSPPLFLLLLLINSPSLTW